ncbi:MAG: putative FAD-linked oxidoreductase [Syntrophus sp. PtaU1.Bin005]|jgi:glycolate oxidase|uniref:FAD-binding oxidoreductase n=1 Tax=Syntrophus buswellii TaxID=43774 RepID=UPI0009C8AEED|nr:MAG: putative FAD-linked oxidoreductase [Syntrophus sp. PtaB.Bin138]OPY82252.1 MAG: putative FAD-linked oxidoreductase [Syntrophus sp. PtaU1.Bin005]
MISESVLVELQNILGREDVLTAREILKTYSYDGTSQWTHEPDAVVFPRTAEQVSAIMKLANAHRIPVTPRGGGTNVSGGSIPVLGGIVLCTTKMDKILNIDRENFTATVECGVVLMNFNTRLAAEGLFFPPDPQSFLAATIGGIVAENAGGPAGVKYGVTKQYLLGLEVVLPTGEIIQLGGRTVKNVVGYDLTMLFCSSEGTLGIITKAEFKVNAIPPAKKTILAIYDDVAVAGENVSLVLKSGVTPAKIELLDNWLIHRIEEASPLGLPGEADAVLIFEVDGMAEAVEKEADKIIEIARMNGAREVRPARDQDEANRFWMARRAGFAMIFGRAPTVLAEDVTVPRGQIPALIRKCRELSRKYDLEIVVMGHAGDGNLHPSVLTDIKDREHFARAEKAVEGIIEAALELGGVLSGEHGIGLEKQRFFRRALGPTVTDLMKNIKSLVDPNNIMNPGKIWD